MKFPLWEDGGMPEPIRPPEMTDEQREGVMRLLQREALEAETCHLAQTLDGADPCGRCMTCYATRIIRGDAS